MIEVVTCDLDRVDASRLQVPHCGLRLCGGLRCNGRAEHGQRLFWQQIVFDDVVQILVQRRLGIDGQQKAGSLETIDRLLQDG